MAPSTINRAIVIVLDGCGIGEAPDTAAYGDTGSNTIANTARAVGGLNCPYLEQLGLGHLADVAGVARVSNPTGCFGTMREQAAGKDSTSGHWELMGVTLTRPFPIFPEGFPPRILEPFRAQTGRGILGNKAASGTAIVEELGAEHLRTGDWIVYTSADSVFQIAAHEDIIPISQLYDACRVARSILQGTDAVGRVIARPFIGQPGSFTRTSRRRDFSLEPSAPTVLDQLMSSGIPTIGIGKIEDLFAGRGLSHKIHTSSNVEGMNVTVSSMGDHPQGLVFTNLVEFDMVWGHRNDPHGFANSLEEFDRQLGDMFGHLTDHDALFIVADHGVDPTTPSTDHSRELIPLLAYGPSLRQGVSLGRRDTFADLASTLCDLFDLPLAVKASTPGTSFWREIVR